jgi:hypothetical protein
MVMLIVYALAVAFATGCSPLSECPTCPRAPERAQRTVCIDEAFGGDVAAVRAAVARWDAALCGVVRVRSRIVDPISEPCALTVMRVDPAWQWVTYRPANSPGWADPERGLAWIVTPTADLESIAAHEIGHLLGASHDTLTRHPQACVGSGSAVQAAYQTGTQTTGPVPAERRP